MLEKFNLDFISLCYFSNMTNYAFIDGQNLYLGIKAIGWKIDYRKFRRYLREKYRVQKAFMFMGFLPENQALYQFLQEANFLMIFKPILALKDIFVKGNCDAELVLHAMIEYPNYDRAVIITGDGDFYCLVDYLNQHEKLEKVLAPSVQTCSALLQKAARNKLNYISDLQKKLSYTKRTP